MQLERFIHLLETVAIAGRPISAARLQKATQLPRPTVYRLVQTLSEHGLLDEVGEEGRYAIGARLVKLALLGKSDIDARKAASASIKQAAIHLGQACFLARLRNRSVEIIHVETPDDLTKAFVHPGMGNRPMHACSSSKVIAAFSDELFQRDLLSGTFERFNDNTHESLDTLVGEFLRIRECGYALCDQEISLGISSIAAPVQFMDINPSFSVGVVAHANEFTSEVIERTGEYLLQLAERVGAAIQLCNVAEV